MDPRKPNAKHQRFVEEYLVDLNATQAAIRAGYSAKTAKVQGSRLLTNAAISEAIRAGREKLAQGTAVTAGRIREGLAKIAFAEVRSAFDKDGKPLPLHAMPPDISLAINSIETDELLDGQGENRRSIGVTRKLKVSDRLRALELLGKDLGMFTDRVELNVTPLAPAEIVRRLNALTPKGSAT